MRPSCHYFFLKKTLKPQFFLSYTELLTAPHTFTPVTISFICLAQSCCKGWSIQKRPPDAVLWPVPDRKDELSARRGGSVLSLAGPTDSWRHAGGHI